MTLTDWIAALPDDLRPRFEPMLDPNNGLLGVPIAKLFNIAPPENAATASEPERRAWAQAVLARQAEVLNVAAPMSMAVGVIFHTPSDQPKIEPNLRRGITTAREQWAATSDPAYLTLATEGLRQLARWLARQRRSHDAAAAYEELLAIEPANALEWQNLGAIYKNQLNDPTQAMRCFQQALSLDSHNTHVAQRELAALEAATRPAKQSLLGRLFGRS
jgi:tetratricopeptide (TPR) repeat protein